MDIEAFRSFCLSLPGTSEDCPFGPDNLVYKVKGKMFALCGIDDFGSINLKCDPERAVELRETYEQITPGFHMNKTHWNTIELNGLQVKFIEELIIHSYDLVRASLSKKLKEEIELGI